MSIYYEDTDQFYEIMGSFLNRLLTDKTIGPKMAKADMIIKFIYTDPEAEITIDLKNPPKKKGLYGTYYLGPCDVEPDAWSKQSSDYSHRFWHGKENPVTSIALGKIKQGGKVTALLKLLPIAKPAFKVFPVVLDEMGLSYLIL
jgi:hypothetical protein